MVKLFGVICSKNDRRIGMAIDKLVQQVDYLLVIDSSTEDVPIEITKEAFKIWQQYFEPSDRIGLLWRPEDNLAQAKNRAVRLLLGYPDTEYLAFIDADMQVPSFWGEAVRARLKQDKPDILIGARAPSGNGTDYEWAMEKQHYDDFRNPKTFVALPQDNTVWSRRVLDIVGHFDEQFPIDGGDIDYGIRAMKAGFVPVFDNNIIAYHDHSHRDSLWKILGRKLSYMIGGAQAYLKHGTLRSRARTRRIYHPIQLLDYPMMALAVFVAKLKLQEVG